MRKKAVRVAEPRPVDFDLNPDDLECALLGKAGWHTQAIAEATGLTQSQVTYRLGRAGVKRADYRNGQSEMAKFVLAQIRWRSNAKRRLASANRFPHQIDVLQVQFTAHFEEYRSRQAA